MRPARIVRDAAGVLAWALLWGLRLAWAPYLLLRLDVLDWLLLTITITTRRWEAAALFLVQFAARRTPFLARALACLAWVDAGAEWVGWILPGLIMSRSSSEEVGTSSEPAEPELVPGRSNAVCTGTCTSGVSPVISLHMSRQELIAILAVQEADGQPVFSSNKIAGLFEKTALTASRSVMLDEVDAVRNGPPQPQSVSTGRLERPQGGW